jgi:DNA-binding transcriptional ArsR family regulator
LSSRSKSVSSADKRLADYDAVFAALDSAARRQILLILHFRGDSMTAGEIADRFSCSWPTTSRHLRKLESAGLVEVERAGREWIYRLDRRRLRVAADWLDWFSAPRGAGVTVSVQPKSKRGPAVRPNRNRNTGT